MAFLKYISAKHWIARRLKTPGDFFWWKGKKGQVLYPKEICTRCLGVPDSSLKEFFSYFPHSGVEEQRKKVKGYEFSQVFRDSTVPFAICGKSGRLSSSRLTVVSSRTGCPTRNTGPSPFPHKSRSSASTPAIPRRSSAGWGWLARYIAPLPRW